LNRQPDLQKLGGNHMAGFFGLFDYTKEGKGVYPDEPPKGPIPTFFAILGRKFWKICTINLMYIVFSLPALILAFFASTYIIGILLPNLNMDTLAKVFEEAGYVLKEGVTIEMFVASQMVIGYFVFAMLLTGLSLIIVGPVHAGATYLLRNYSREEHAFVWSDFKEHAIKNFKQSLISSLIGLAVTLLLVINFVFYSSGEIINNYILQTILRTISILLLIFWCIIQMYIYPMMVTFNLSLKQLYKNCMLFSILKLPLNILILLFSLIILFVLPAILFFMGYGASVLGAFLWYLFFAFGINLLMTNFFVYRGLDKYMIQKIKAAEELNEENEGEASETVDEPQEEEQQKTEKPQDEDKGLVESPSQASN
jgi:uncharacterized membrane protein YesL